jgi:hypothetical protein
LYKSEIKTQSTNPAVKNLIQIKDLNKHVPFNDERDIFAPDDQNNYPQRNKNSWTMMTDNFIEKCDE